MPKRQMMLTFPQELIKEPIIYRLSQRFKVIPNIRRADITENRGWVVLELEGTEKNVEAALKWVAEQGVRVDPVVGDMVEG